MDELAGDVPLGVERLVAAPVVATHQWVDDDRRAVVQGAGRVVAQDDGVGDPFGVPAHPEQREEVVAVKTGVADLNAHPRVGHVRFGPLTDLQCRKRIVGGGVRGVHCEHRPDLRFKG